MDAVLTALVEDRIGPGEQAKELIKIAREKLEFDYCMALRSPATALFTALKSLGLTEGQGVVLSALSPIYYLNVLNDLKLKPIYADVEPGSPVMGRETLEKALNSRPEGLEVKAVILHHTLGYVPDSAAISESGLPLIEDRSQSYGSSGKSVSAGSAVLTILGLEERDMLTAGGGALLYAGNRRDAAILRSIGELPPEYGLPDMNAAMGTAQFRGASKNIQRRQEIADAYYKAASRTRHKCFIQESDNTDDLTEADTRDRYNNYAFALILETGMKDVKAYAKRKDVIVESAFDKTLAGAGIVAAGICPQAYSLTLRTVLFPLYPRLHTEEIERISKLIVTLP